MPSAVGDAAAAAAAPWTCVRVAVRVRPLNAKELLLLSPAPSQPPSECLRIIPNQPQIVVIADAGLSHSNFPSSRSFTFDDVFGPGSRQDEVYSCCVRPLVLRFLDGFNSTALAYGQTGSGKTWSMGTGLDTSSLPPEQVGIVPRAIQELFSELTARQQRRPEGFKFNVFVSFLELYNEDLVDLLNPRPRTAGSGGGPTIREDAQGNIVWGGVKEEEVSSPEEMMSCLQRGSLCRSTASTDMNASSSRSHAIFSIILRQQRWTPNPSDGGPDTATNSHELLTDAIDDKDSLADPTSHPDGSWRGLVSKFHFVDLAGSERLKRTNAEGDRKKEGISINQGLLALGNVISALGDESRRAAHVPYRDSKLTRMLQDSLGGNSQTLMLACVSPSDSSYGETINTLNYANRARNIRNRVVVNQEFLGAGGGEREKEVRALRALVADLREEIAQLRAGGAQGGRLTHERQVALDAAVVERERQVQIHMKGEREMAARLEVGRREIKMLEFEIERLTFLSLRLSERNREVTEELSSVTAERDAASIELGRWRAGRIPATVPSLSVPSAEPRIDTLNAPSTEPQATQSSVQPASMTELDVIASYNRSISDLRMRLSEAEDRLAWYHDMVAELQGGNKRRNAPAMLASLLSSIGPDVSLTRPANRSIDDIQMSLGDAPEVNHERLLLKALKTDPELGKVLSQSNTKEASPMQTTTDLDSMKLYGLPRIATNSIRPSNLGAERTEIDHPQDDDDGYTDDEHDGDGGDVSGIPIAADSSRIGLSSGPITAASTKSSSSTIADRSAEIYLLVHRLQADITDHQATVDRLARREQEYETMRGAYESKLNVLQSQVAVIMRERDEALKRMIAGGPATVGTNGRGGRGGSAGAVRARFDEEKRKLETQIAELRKKLNENARMNGRSRNEGLTKTLTATIEALKVEKANMLKELKKEAERSRNIKTEKEREIARLRRKEKAAAEVAKKLERSNQLQRLMIKRRSEEVVSSHSKLKSVMSLLKRGGSGSLNSASTRVQKPSGMISPVKRPRSRQIRSSTPMLLTKEVLQHSMSQKSDVDIPALLSNARPASPPPEVRAKFKRQMIEKELRAVVQSQLVEIKLKGLGTALDRLVGEQRELLAERERCVAADAERTGVSAPHLPQYMDERLGVLDLEIAMTNSKIKKVEEENRVARPMAQLVASQMEALDGKITTPSYIPSMSDGELSWENALNLLRSLDSLELELVSTLFLGDLVDAKVALNWKETALSDSEKAVSELRAALDTMRAAALQTALEYRNELEQVRAEVARRAALSEGTESKPITPPTPRIQRMFDAAYGQGVVVVKSSASSTTSLVEVTDSETSGWGTADEPTILMSKKRGIAPAAAAALEAQKTGVATNRTRSLSGSAMTSETSRSLSPSRPGGAKGGAATPPRGKAAAAAAAAGAAAVEVARQSELGVDAKVAEGQPVTPPRGRQQRPVDPMAEGGSSDAGQVSPRRSSNSGSTDGELLMKKTLNTKRGPPLSPHNSNMSRGGSEHPALPSNLQTSYVSSSSAGEENSNVSSASPVPRSKSAAPERIRSPSWTFGKDSLNQQNDAKGKSSAATYLTLSPETEDPPPIDESLEGWQSFGMNTSSTSGTSKSRPSSSRLSSDGADAALRGINKKRSASPLGGSHSSSAASVGHSSGDVFVRLATSHTLASQAKVIHREKEYVVGEAYHGHTIGKKPSVSDNLTASMSSADASSLAIERVGDVLVLENVETGD